MMTERLPIEMILAANDYVCECMMVIYGCKANAVGLIYVNHADGTPLCGGTNVLLMCQSHGASLLMGLTSSPLMAVMGAPPVPPCEECGKPLVLGKATNLRGEPL
jgi:hypothetical protein